MATFDQLSAEQRAIIELVVRRGRSYQSLADVLEIPTARVRELAREALAELSPVTARMLDDDWRAQLADYLLGQQTGPESTATRSHLKRSEPARAWALSLIDSLDSLYGNGSRPVIPDADGGAALAAPERERPPRERGRARRAREAPEPPTEAPAAAPAPAPAPKAELSPEARERLRRRRLIGGVGLAALAAAIVIGVLAATGTIFGGSTKHTAQSARVAVGAVPLTAQDGSKAAGFALVARRGSEYQVIIQASGVKPALSNGSYVYAVWLYNGPNDLGSLGAQVTNAQGQLSGQGALPSTYNRFKYIDVTYEKLGPSIGHNGPLVLRGAFANIKPVSNQPSASQTTPTP